MEQSKERTDEIEYLAFISYRHADNKEEDRQWATWLHQQLEVYDIPADLIGTTNLRGEIVPERIYPVFRDEVSLPADADLSHAITHALDRSRFLIVLCSPRAVQSYYVNEEILHFKRTGKQDQIMAALVLGEPNASIDDAKLEDPEDARTLECFPSALQYHLKADGELDTSQPTEPIAANFRLPDGGKGITNPQVYKQQLLTQGRKKADAEHLSNAYEEQLNTGKLKIIAGILGVRLEQLTQRDKIHQLNKAKAASKRFMRIAGLMSVLAVVAMIGGGLAYTNWQRAEQEKARAEDLLGQMRTHLNFMNHDLHDVMKGYVPQDKRIPIMQRIDGMVEALQQYGGQTGIEQREIAVALMQKADLILNNSALNPAEAAPLYDKAHVIFQALLEQQPTNTENQFDLLRIHQRFGHLYMRSVKFEKARMHYEASLKIAQKLVAQNSANTPLRQQIILELYKNLGKFNLDTVGDYESALMHLEAGLEIAKALIAQDAMNIQLQQDLSYLHKGIGRYKLRQEEYETARLHLEAGLRGVEVLVQKEPENMQFQQDLTGFHQVFVDLNLKQGNYKAARVHLEVGLKIAKALIDQDPENRRVQRILVLFYSHFTMLAFQENDRPTAAHYMQLAQEQLDLMQDSGVLSAFDKEVNTTLKYMGELLKTTELTSNNPQEIFGITEIQRKLLEVVVAQNPNNAKMQDALAVTYAKLGELSLQQNDTEMALAHYEAALKTHKAVVAQDSTSKKFRTHLSRSYGEIGKIHLRLGENIAALRHFKAALEIDQKLVEQDPTNVKFQSNLTISYYMLSRANEKAKDLTAALGFMESANEHFLKIREAGALTANEVQFMDTWQGEIVRLRNFIKTPVDD